MGIIMVHKQEGHKSKIEDRGKEAIFVGYSNTHAGDAFQFSDIATKQMKISRDVRWTGEFYANGNYIEIPNYHQNAKIDILDIREEIGVLEETKPENENKVEIENDRVQMTYDPTRDDVTDILLVGGMDESYEAPEKFEEAWNNKIRT